MHEPMQTGLKSVDSLVSGNNKSERAPNAAIAFSLRYKFIIIESKLLNLDYFTNRCLLAVASVS